MKKNSIKKRRKSAVFFNFVLMVVVMLASAVAVVFALVFAAAIVVAAAALLAGEKTRYQMLGDVGLADDGRKSVDALPVLDVLRALAGLEFLERSERLDLGELGAGVALDGAAPVGIFALAVVVEVLDESGAAVHIGDPAALVVDVTGFLQRP